MTEYRWACPLKLWKYTLVVILLATPFGVKVAARPMIGPPTEISVELRYPMAEAGEVVLVWGIDDWKPVDEALWPPGTTQESTLRTVMTREGDVFVARLRVPPRCRLDYGFLSTKDRLGVPCPHVWDGDHRREIGDVDLIVDVRAAVVLARSAAKPVAPDAPLIEQEIRYRLPQASEVLLVWGINGWTTPPPRMRPPGTAVAEDKARTPMARTGEVFAVRVSVPEGTVVDFFYKIIALQTGARTEVSDNRWYEQFGEEGGAYRVVARPDTPIEIEAGPAVIDRLFPWTFSVSPAGFGLIALAAAVMLVVIRLGWGVVRSWSPARRVRAGIEHTGRIHRIPVAVAAAIAGAPLALVFLFSAYLVVGFRQSPFLPDVFAPDFRWAEGNRFVFKENSGVEWLTFAFLLAAGVLGIALAWRLWRVDRVRFAAAFYAVFALGAIVVAMEEVAWGQWILGFEPPEIVSSLNSQKELTLHNLEGFQGRSEYLEVLFALGGLVGILLTALGFLRRIAPPLLLLPWMLAVAVLAGLDLANDYIEIERYLDWGVRQLTEVAEMMIGITIFLYVWLNARRLAGERHPHGVRTPVT